MSSPLYQTLQQTYRQRAKDGQTLPLLAGTDMATHCLVLVWPQLGDFDSMEYAWWLQRQSSLGLPPGLAIRAVGIGDLSAGQKFCQFTGFPADWLFLDPKAALHRELGLYAGLQVKLPGLGSSATGFLNLMLMCAGIGSPGTLAEVWRGYRGDRQAPQLIEEGEEVQAGPLPKFSGRFFNLAGGTGHQRPFELATLRLRNMTEVLGNWTTYVPNPAYLTQRGGTFLFNAQGELVYEHRDRGILGFAANMSNPLKFLEDIPNWTISEP